MRLELRFLLLCFVGLCLLQSRSPEVWAGPAAARAVVPQCQRVTLTASYLAQVTAADGPGFDMVIKNDTDKMIRLVRPFPSSAHWYAQSGVRWMWRASSGSGGSLVNSLNEHGALFAYRHEGDAHPEYLTVGAHQSLELAQSVLHDATLRYRPGCEHCGYAGEQQFRAVLAYAYLPSEAEIAEGVLACGLRSGLVVMPPLAK